MASLPEIGAYGGSRDSWVFRVAGQQAGAQTKRLRCRASDYTRPLAGIDRAVLDRGAQGLASLLGQKAGIHPIVTWILRVDQYFDRL